VGKNPSQPGQIIGYPLPSGEGLGGQGQNVMRAIVMTPNIQQVRFGGLRKRLKQLALVGALGGTLTGINYGYENRDYLSVALTYNAPPGQVDSPLEMPTLEKNKKGEWTATGPKVSGIAHFVLDHTSLKYWPTENIYGVSATLVPNEEKVSLVFPVDPKTGERECPKNIKIFTECLGNFQEYRPACVESLRGIVNEVQDHAGFFAKNSDEKNITGKDLRNAQNNYSVGNYSPRVEKDGKLQPKNPDTKQPKIVVYAKIDTGKKDKKKKPIYEEHALGCIPVKK